MSRIRTIKPEFWTSEQVMECSPMARLAFIGMWNFCDDQGVHPGSAKTLKAEVFPGDDIASACVSLMVNELVENGLICEFSAKGKQWWFVKGWHHQLIKNPSTPKYPAPPGESNTEDCPSPTPVLPQSYPSPTPVLPQSYPQEGKGREGKGKGEERKGEDQKQAQPAADEVGEKPKKPAAIAAARFDAAEFLIEQGAERQTVADYLTLRKGKKAASTATAMQAIVREAGKAGMGLQDALTLCCSKGWAGFEASWVVQQARAGPRQTLHDQRKATLDELTGRNRHATETQQPRDITAEVIRIA